MEIKVLNRKFKLKAAHKVLCSSCVIPTRLQDHIIRPGHFVTISIFLSIFNKIIIDKHDPQSIQSTPTLTLCRLIITRIQHISSRGKYYKWWHDLTSWWCYLYAVYWEQSALHVYILINLHHFTIKWVYFITFLSNFYKPYIFIKLKVQGRWMPK